MAIPRLLLAPLLLLGPPAGEGGALPGPEALLARAIAHHDPQGLWGRSVLRLVLVESRPDGSGRQTELVLDQIHGRFDLQRRQDGQLLEGTLVADECSVRVDGTAEVDAALLEAYRLTCPELRRWRDYYGYLWGLPMKLRDPGTPLGQVEGTSFRGRPVHGLRVAYREPLGSDTWYFYFHRESGALTGYRFHHDEAARDGEYVVLEGETPVGSLRLPRSRAWYAHQGDRHLGTDTLVSGEVVRTRGAE